MAALRLVPLIGEDVEVDQDHVVVGREPNCDVVVENGSVSRKHAVLERRGEVWFVVDQASANGTFVDGARVGESPLRHGQELRFGTASYRVELPGEEALGANATMLTPGMDLGAPARPPAARPAPGVPPLPPRASAPPPPPAHGAARAAGLPPPPPLEGGGEAAPPKKGKSPLFWVAAGCSGCLLLVLLFVGLLAGGAYFLTGGAASAVKEHLADLGKGDLDAAYGRLSEDYREGVRLEEFTAFVARHPSLQEHRDSTFWSRNVSNDQAVIAGRLESRRGVRESASYRLIKRDGWKISAIEVEGEALSASRRRPAAGMTLTGNLDKGRDGELVRVNIRAEVAGFDVRPEEGQYGFELAEDVETLGPDGQPVAALTRSDVERHRGRTSLAEGAVFPFTRTLTLDPASLPGTYTVRMTVRDQVGGGQATRELQFQMP